VNHSCFPNSTFEAQENGKLYVKAIQNIESGDEITVQYSLDYFGDANKKCLCTVCSTVRDRKFSGN